MKSRVLIAEDEENLANTLALNLQLEGYEVILCSNGRQALDTFLVNPSLIDLALLDVMLPELNGFDLCGEMRRARPKLPVIFLTAKSQLNEKREGLRRGADDYITKPFDLEELLLRISNLLKRSTEKSEVFVFSGGQINFSTFEILDRKGTAHRLSKREIGLLKLLTGNPRHVISRDMIINSLWDSDENASSRTIDNYILNFRKLFEENPRSPQHFSSIRGVGYRFDP